MVVALISLYLVASIAYLYSLFSTHRGVIYRLGFGALVLGFALHTVLMGVHYSTTSSHGWGSWLSSLSWAIILLYLLAYFRYRDIALGGFAVPAAFVLEGYASALPGVGGAGSQAVQGFLLSTHTVMAILSAGAFFLLFAAALMFIVQSQELKSKRPGAWLQRFPSLDVLDDLNHKILYIGFSLLSMSLLLGSMWAKSRHGTYWSLDPLRTFPLVVTWLGYGILLVCRLTRSWKGKRAAVFSIVNFVAVLIALFVHI